MSHQTLALEQEIRIDASQEKVFRLLTQKDEMARWMPVSVFEPRLGGRFELDAGEWVAVGEVTEFDPPRRVAYTWDWRNQPLGTRTEVTFELEPDGKGTLVRLRHEGFASPEQVESHTAGWQHYGERLSTVAEGRDPGPDTMAGESDREASRR